MPEIKLTKNELRTQQVKQKLLQKYLPTLQLKKSLLQAEVQETRQAIEKLSSELEETRQKVSEFAALLATLLPIDLAHFVKVASIQKHYENIAGIDVPQFEGVTYEPLSYDLFDTPVWLESAITRLRALTAIEARIKIDEEKKRLLEKELREVSIRVNLFEKILIPRTEKNIKKIKIFLGDAELAAVAQAKVAKAKIEKMKEMSRAS